MFYVEDYLKIGLCPPSVREDPHQIRAYNQLVRGSITTKQFIKKLSKYKMWSNLILIQWMNLAVEERKIVNKETLRRVK